MDLWQDVRFGARLLVKARWFTLAAGTALALGIGANTTVFTLVNAVLFRQLPFDDPESIVSVWMENEQNQRVSISHPNYLDLRDQSQTLGSLSAILNTTVNLADDGQAPARIQGAYVSANFFRMLGEQPVLGRDFVDEDDREGAEPAVILGHSVWQDRYGGDPGVLGLSIRVNSLVGTVIGVMPPNMRFPNNTDLWIPTHMLPPASRIEDRAQRNFNIIGRLANGSSIELAREELGAIGRRLADAYPGSNEDLGFNLMSFQKQQTEGNLRTIFLMLLGAVVFVLLIACANVANLLLARSADREREIAVRVSLGATRGRIVRQLLIESALLAILAGGAGLAISVFGIRWFDGVTAGDTIGKPYYMDFTMDPIVFAYMAGICLLTAVLFGLAPALQVSKTNVNEVLKEGSRGSSGGRRARRWADVLIVCEIVMTLVLLSGAGFMMGSFFKLASMDLGIDTSRLLTMELYLPLTQYPEPDPRAELYEELEERLTGLGAIQASTLTTALPLSGGASGPVQIDGMGDPGEALPQTTVLWVSDGYLDALGVQMVGGRFFGADDGLPGSEVAVINQRFVEMHLGGGDALGRRVRFGNQAADAPDDDWVTIVGVIPNIRQNAIQEVETDPVAYMPLRSNPVRQVRLLVRTSANPGSAMPLVREAMSAVQPDLPLFNIMTMDVYLAEQRWPFRVFGLMFSVFAGVALILSAVGLYSVTAHSVTQRTQEIGIRVAHGAQPRQVTWLVLRRALIQLAIGLPIGLLGAVLVGWALQGLVVQTSPIDPLTLGTIVAVLAVVAVVACILPAQRAARLDPMVAFRVE
ncbi:MAG: ABC transporter permease [Gemmatimonadetes bacterium]|nr:ABC transporter permease [Gemmatimonadota bacterium]